MTNPEARPLSRDDVPGPDGVRERIDAADREAEAAVARAEAEHGAGAEHGAEQDTEQEAVAEDVSPATPTPEPPD